MKLLSYIKYPILLIVTSFFFFPFEFTFLPGINTKMLLAAMGLVLFVARAAASRSASLDRDFFVLIVSASIVSLSGIISVVYNATTDLSYASYVVSFFVWMGGAYFVVSSIRFLHGKVTPLMVINYLAAICVVQCVLALLADCINHKILFVEITVGNQLYNIGIVTACQSSV